MRAVGLNTHIWNNNLKSAVLLAGFPVLLLLMIWVFVFLLKASMGLPPQTATVSANNSVINYGHWAILAALGWFIIAWLFHTKMIATASGAREITRSEEPELYNMLENLCISRGIAMPKFQIIESPGLNAFASGINDKTYCITLTRGLLDRLENDEIEAVIAHELTHIMNRDVRLLIISVVFVGMIGFLAQMLFRTMIYGTAYRSRNRKSDPRIMIIALIVLAIGYFFAILIRFAISRRREYMADAGAVELTKNPDAMMRALMKISGNDYVEETPADIEQMCIENSHKFMGMFATHPPIEDRVEAISQATGAPRPNLITMNNASDYEINRGQNPWAKD